MLAVCSVKPVTSTIIGVIYVNAVKEAPNPKIVTSIMAKTREFVSALNCV